MSYNARQRDNWYRLVNGGRNAKEAGGHLRHDKKVCRETGA